MQSEPSNVRLACTRRFFTWSPLASLMLKLPDRFAPMLIGEAALRALTQPIAVIAQAIDEGDLGMLKSLPGIGEQRAKEIVAKLQGKVGKYALMQAKERASTDDRDAKPIQRELEEEAIAVLVQLEYKLADARQMVRAALERNAKVGTVEALLNEVYRQQRQMVETAQ